MKVVKLDITRILCFREFRMNEKEFQIFLWIMPTIYVNNFMLTMARVKSAPIRQLRQICVINAIYRLNIFLSAQHLGNHEFVYVNRDEHDLKDLARRKKKSFYWYKDTIANNGKDI